MPKVLIDTPARPPEIPSTVERAKDTFSASEARTSRHGALEGGWWAPLLGLLVVATALRLYHLDAQLWLDEVSALTGSIRRPLIDIVTVWPGATSHVFYEMWAHLSLVVFGESALAIRLPAALFGVAGVATMYLLAARLFERGHAFVIAALFAVSYHDIFYSQDARSYTALIFFFLVASYLFVGFRGAAHISWRTGVAYALTLALAVYSNLFGVFIFPVQVVITLWLWLRARQAGRAPSMPVRAILVYAIIGETLTGLLYLPFVGSVLAYTQFNARTASEGPRLGLALVEEVVAGLSAGLFGPMGMATAGLVALLGLVFWWRRDAFALAVLVGPIILQGLAVVPLGIGIHPRYFAMALPVVFLLGGGGLVVTVHALAQRIPVRPTRRHAIEAIALGVVVLASMFPLLRYYSVPKQDFLGAMQTVEALREPDEAAVGVYLAGHVFASYYHAGYGTVDSLDDLLTAEASGKRLLLVTTLEPLLAIHDRALYQYIRQNYHVVKFLPGTVGDAEMRVYAPVGG